MEKPFAELINQTCASANARLGAPATNTAHCTGESSDGIHLSDTVHPVNIPRTVIRGKVPPKKEKNHRQL